MLHKVNVGHLSFLDTWDPIQSQPATQKTASCPEIARVMSNLISQDDLCLQNGIQQLRTPHSDQSLGYANENIPDQ